MAVYWVSALVVFLVVAWFTRSREAGDLAGTPVWWRLSGFFVWVSMFLGGFAGVTALLSPLVTPMGEPAASLVGGAVLGAVVALVVRLGSALALHGDVRAWRWGVLFQVVALGGDLVAAQTNPYNAVAALIPVVGLVCLAMAFRTRAEAAPAPPPPPVARRRKRR